MTGNHHRRLERLEHAPALQPPARWQVWSGDEAAWADVAPEVQDDLQRQYRLAGGGEGPPFVRRRRDGSWGLVTLALPYGALTYRIGELWKEQGTLALWCRLQLATVEELAVWCRLLDAGWSAAALQDGDLAQLEPLVSRISAPQAAVEPLPTMAPTLWHRFSVAAFNVAEARLVRALDYGEAAWQAAWATLSEDERQQLAALWAEAPPPDLSLDDAAELENNARALVERVRHQAYLATSAYRDRLR